MDAETFKTMTRLGVFNGRKSLEAIDTLLTLCTGLDAKVVDQRIALMAMVMDECQKWLAAKRAISDANTGKRRPGVERLLDQAQKRHAYELFEKKKQKTRRLGAMAPRTRTLQSGYVQERVQFTKQRADLREKGTYTPGVTITPVGGSWIHAMHDVAKKGHTETPAPPRAFAELTLDDYDAYAAAPVNDRELVSHQLRFVHYMRKEERLGNMLVVQDGLLMYRGTKFDTQTQQHMYVMDQYGNLFVKHVDSSVTGRTVGTESSQFNHSSLNAGNSVISAGIISAASGVLTAIDNCSGHYQPRYQNLHECLRYLVDDGLNISSAMIQIMTGPNMGFGPWEAKVFLDNPESCLCDPPVTRARSGAAAEHATRVRGVAFADPPLPPPPVL
jgi:hypothetical protein